MRWLWPDSGHGYVEKTMVYTWVNYGRAGAKLDAVLIGASLRTSRAAIERFKAALGEEGLSAIRTGARPTRRKKRDAQRPG